MRMISAAIVLAVLPGSAAFAQGTFMDNFERGWRLGQAQRAQQSEEARRQAEAEYYRQQALLIKQQRELVERQAKELAAKNASTQNVEAQAAEWTRILLQLFERKHPDYKQHEQDMVKFGVLLPPSDRMNPMDYLEALYLLAKSDIPC
jgi:hypothetical protein